MLRDCRPWSYASTSQSLNSQVVLDSGPVIPALAASCALPALSRPVLREGRVLIDGGCVNPLPYDVVMTRAEFTVAVDVTCSQPCAAADPKAAAPGTLQLLAGATQMLFCALTREKLKAKAPDVLIRPSVAAFAALDYFRVAEIFAAARPAKQELKSKLSQWLATAR
jgi:NTE family protein